MKSLNLIKKKLALSKMMRRVPLKRGRTWM
jgi:hypothetical protein